MQTITPCRVHNIMYNHPPFLLRNLHVANWMPESPRLHDSLLPPKMIHAFSRRSFLTCPAPPPRTPFFRPFYPTLFPFPPTHPFRILVITDHCPTSLPLAIG